MLCFCFKAVLSDDTQRSPDGKTLSTSTTSKADDGEVDTIGKILQKALMRKHGEKS